MIFLNVLQFLAVLRLILLPEIPEFGLCLRELGLSLDSEFAQLLDLGTGGVVLYSHVMVAVLGFLVSSLVGSIL